MFHARRAQIRRRQSHLLARSAALRHRLARQSDALQAPLAAADRVRNGFGWLRSHPWSVGAIVAVPVLLRPRRAVGWALKLWWGWRLLLRLRAALPR